MSATLPTPLTTRSRALAAPAWIAIALAVSVLVIHGRAAALDVQLGTPRARGGSVVLEARLGDLFPVRVEESLARGMPATLRLHAELWRQRNGWFDRLERSFDTELRIRYDVWSDSYRLERQGSPPLAVASLDSATAALSRPWSIPVARVWDLKPQSRYFVVLTATLRPLSVEDVREVEGWLSGEVEDKRRSGLGVVTELPRALFDAVRNLAGFGDQRARAETGVFRVGDLLIGP